MSAKDPKGRKAAEGDRRACEMSSEFLHLAFDKEDKSHTERVARHVSNCDPCETALQLLQAQRDALAFLTHVGVSNQRTGVEYLLARSAQAGRESLASLLYEMAKACLVMLPNLKRRIERRIEPRTVAVVTQDLRAMNARLGTTATGVTILHVPPEIPTEPRALATASSCLQVLQNVEGETERQVLALSQVLIFQAKPAEAESILRELLARTQPLEHRDLAQWNLMLALMRQKRYVEVIEFGQGALNERPNDFMVLYNLAASFAALRKRAEFEAMSDRLAKELATRDGGPPEWLIGLLRFEVPNFAECFGASPAEIERRFGLASSSEGHGK